MNKIEDTANLNALVDRIVNETPVYDMHTHLYHTDFKGLLLFGIDEILTYHYLVAEFFRYSEIPYKKFWTLQKKEQAELVWDALFVKRTPISESTLGVVEILNSLGIPFGDKDLTKIREYFSRLDIDKHIAKVFELAGIKHIVTTNDPFDENETAVWKTKKLNDDRFHTSLRLDSLFAKEAAIKGLKKQGYDIKAVLDKKSEDKIKKFLEYWIEMIKPEYLAASFSFDLAFPENSFRAKVLERCILPLCADHKLPFALMIGVSRTVNPELKLAGDGIGRADIRAVEYLCRNYPSNKFFITFLSRENQHEVCVLARKFKNLMVFGCWWFLNIPSIIEEITRERIELLGTGFIPQHSDARVLEQLIYKWKHSKTIISKILADRYSDVIKKNWVLTEEDIRRDINSYFYQNFKDFLSTNFL